MIIIYFILYFQKSDYYVSWRSESGHVYLRFYMFLVLVLPFLPLDLEIYISLLHWRVILPLILISASSDIVNS